MNDFLTRDNISNGFFTTTNLIDFAHRNDIKNIGIVEIEEVPLYDDKKSAYFGTELLLSNYGESLVLFNINDTSAINNVLISRKKLYLPELEEQLLSTTQDSLLFKKVYENDQLSINYACKLLIKLGYYNGFRESFNGFVKPFLNRMPNISMEDLNILSKNSKMYFCINDIDKLVSNNFIKNIDKYYGVLYYGNVSLQSHSKLVTICNKYNLDLKFGTNFSDHRLGENIGVKLD